MTKNDKIAWLQQNALDSYIKARAKVEKELDELTPMFCFCGKLATGFHTSHCMKYQDRMKTKIVDQLGYLIPSKQ